MSRRGFALSTALAVLLSGPAPAGPDASVQPFRAGAVGLLDWGIFCADQPMDREAAPGTVAGWLHVPREDIPFHWPGLRQVPAAIGIGFGIRAAGAAAPIPGATVIVTRPGPDGKPLRESWTSDFGAEEPSFSFFRFDTPDEMQTGPWDFQIYKNGERLAQVGFTVVDAGVMPEIVNTCTGHLS